MTSIEFLYEARPDFNLLRTKIETLRMAEYANAKGFSLDLNYLKWRESDEQSYVMFARKDDEIVATMRGELIEDLELLEKKLECPWDLPFEVNGPVLLLSRAATSRTAQNNGLNLLLRYHFLKLAEHHGVRHVIGTFVSGSSRENTLRNMGYQLFEHKLGWTQSSYKSHRPVHIAVLDLKKDGETAFAYCEAQLKDQLIDCEISTNYELLKIVRNI